MVYYPGYGKVELDNEMAALYKRVDQATDIVELRATAREAVNKLWEAERALLGSGVKKQYGHWMGAFDDMRDSHE